MPDLRIHPFGAPSPPPLAGGNLPAQPTSFIGRCSERAAVRSQFGQTRLLTLTGAGGSGKTRLALAAASDLLPARAGGVWLVELAALADPKLVAAVVAASLGLPERPGRRPLALLVEHLAGRQALVVLDNCEHLIHAAAALAESLLRACPELWILATSREALGIAGESLWPVPPLSLPDPRDRPPLERLRQYDAIALFAERTAAMVPDFTVTAENAGSIARICQRLDGLPLAIELAAALVKVLSLEQIDGRLHERFQLLTAGRRTAPPRHKTLRGAMDWSHDLLTGAEQALWRRLSVFAGGFTLAAAEAVCSGADLPPDQVLDLLHRLVEKSLVTAEESGGEKRFRLLETIREYGRGRLREAAEEAALRARHYDWCLALVEAAGAEQWGPQYDTAYDLLEREHDNLRAALDWSRSTPGGAARAIRLAWALLYFWDTRGHLNEGRQSVAELLASPAVPLQPLERASLETLGGMLAFQLGEYAPAVAMAGAGLTVYRAAGNQLGMGRCLLVLGAAAHHRGEVGSALAMLEESLTRFGAAGDESFVSLALFFLAEALITQGDFGRARKLHEECLARRRAAGDRQVYYSLKRLARLAALEGDAERAVAYQREGLPLWDPYYKRGVAVGFEDMAAVALVTGQAEWAACLIGAADAVRRAAGMTFAPARLADREQVVALARSQLGEAAFAAAWSRGQAMSPEQVMAYARAEANPGTAQ